MQKAFAVSALIVVAARLCTGQHITPSPSPRPERHVLQLARTQDTAQHIALLDGHVFATVDGLRRYIAALPDGISIIYDPFFDHAPDNPFYAATHDLFALCDQKKIRFSQRHYEP
jgi:hypothetical protein